MCQKYRIMHVRYWDRPHLEKPGGGNEEDEVGDEEEKSDKVVFEAIRHAEPPNYGPQQRCEEYFSQLRHESCWKGVRI